MKTLIKNAIIVNEGKIIESDLLISNNIIQEISNKIIPSGEENIIDIKGSYLIPGLIDDQVHFREPGLTHKGTIYSIKMNLGIKFHLIIIRRLGLKNLA